MTSSACARWSTGSAATLPSSTSVRTLSAGERQLVTLLRAYLARARIVLLDEATCHLDPLAEAQVEGALARRPGTLIVIAHRITSVLRAHRILVLDGTQTWLGTHEDLLSRSPLYRDLVGHWEQGSAPAGAAVSFAGVTNVTDAPGRRT